MTKKLKQIFFYVFMFVLVLPYTQEVFNYFRITPLHGDITYIPEPMFAMKNWFTGSFQKQYDQFTEENIGFRNSLIRLYNQFDFTLFKVAHARGVIVGKDDYLFEDGYIHAYYGDDFVGEDVIDEQVRKMKFVQEELKKRGIDLIVAFAPGKGSFYPEYIPDYLKKEKSLSNYSYYSQRLKQLQINFIDFNKYFLEVKDTSRYLLYPKCSIHWSAYGFTLAADSLLKYIRNLKGIDYPRFNISQINVVDTIINTDYDLGEGMNLICKIPYPPMAYPQLTYDTAGAKQLSLLGIGDSFYKNFYYAEIPQKLFIENGFWYYNKNISNGYKEFDEVSKLDLKQEVEKQNVIVIMSSEVNLWRFPFEFINDLYYLYAPITIENLQPFLVGQMQNDVVWKNKLINKSNFKGNDTITFLKNLADDMIKNQLQLEEEKKQNRIKFFERRIQMFDFLKQETIQKAQNENVPLAEMIHRDAEWLVNHEISNKQKELFATAISIRNNQDLMIQEIEKAKSMNLSIDDMVKADALWIYNSYHK